MKNLEKEIEKKLVGAGLLTIGIEAEKKKWIMVYAVEAMKHLFSKTLDDVIGEDDDFEKNTKDWLRAGKEVRNYLRKDQRVRKKELLK